MKCSINHTTIKRGIQGALDECGVFVTYLKSGSANSTMAIAMIITGLFYGGNVINQHNIEMANISLKIANVNLQTRREEIRSELSRQQANIIAGQYAKEQEIKLAEIRAAANPYLLEPVQQETSPINVFINTFIRGYSIDTPKGETDIAVSIVKVNNRTYTPEQRKLMTMAFHIGQEVGFPETIQALLLQETLAGAFGDRIGDTNLPIGRRSYGVMQMKVATARKVLRKYPDLIVKHFPRRKTYIKLRDEEIIIKLIQDDEFNIRLGTLNFKIHRDRSRSWSQAVVAYNTGQGAANKILQPKKHKYYGYIIKRMISEVRPFNHETKLTL